jgi:hypothetical protein
MTDPVRLCDAIAALLPALRPASGPGAGHRPVSRAVICWASSEAGGPPTAGASPAAARARRYLPRQGRFPGAAAWCPPSGHRNKHEEAGRDDSAC